MALIDSSAVFSLPEAICLRDSLNPSINPRIFQKLSVTLTNGSTKEHGQNLLNSLNLVKDMPQTCKWRNIGKYSKTTPHVNLFKFMTGNLVPVKILEGAMYYKLGI